MVISDRNERTSASFIKRYPHTAGGWWHGTADVDPQALGVQGGNNAYLDGHVEWVESSKWIAHAGVTDATARFYW